MQGANSNNNSSTLTVPKQQQQQQQRGSTSAQGGLTGAGYKGLGLTRQALAALGYRRSSVAVPAHQEESPVLQVSSSDTSTDCILLLYFYNCGTSSSCDSGGSSGCRSVCCTAALGYCSDAVRRAAPPNRLLNW
jgi:hypothetical protein